MMSKTSMFRRFLIMLTTLLATMLIGLLIAQAGVRYAGGMAEFSEWMKQTAGAFLVWRIMLYAATAWYWLKHLKPRALLSLSKDNDRGNAAIMRLNRLQWFAIGLVVIIEIYNVMNQGAS